MSFINNDNIVEIIQKAIYADQVTVFRDLDFTKIFVTKYNKKLCFQLTNKTMQELLIDPYLLYHKIVEEMYYAFDNYKLKEFEDDYEKVTLSSEVNEENINEVGKIPVRKIEL